MPTQTQPTDLRIRLEGQVEVIEEAIAEWELAALELSHPKWRTRWPTTRFDRAQLQTAVKAVEERGEGQFGALVTRLEKIRATVRAIACNRLAELAVPTSQLPLEAVLDELEKERRVVLSQRMGWLFVSKWAVAITGGTTLLWAIAAGSPLPLAGTTAAALVALHAWATAPRLVLTGASLILNGAGVRLSRIEAIELRDGNAHCQLVLHLNDGGGELAVVCPEKPIELFRRLTALGIATR